MAKKQLLCPLQLGFVDDRWTSNNHFTDSNGQDVDALVTSCFGLYVVASY